jgi:hypothetical protein
VPGHAVPDPAQAARGQATVGQHQRRHLHAAIPLSLH